MTKLRNVLLGENFFPRLSWARRQSGNLSWTTYRSPRSSLDALDRLRGRLTYREARIRINIRVYADDTTLYAVCKRERIIMFFFFLLPRQLDEHAHTHTATHKGHTRIQRGAGGDHTVRERRSTVVVPQGPATSSSIKLHSVQSTPLIYNNSLVLSKLENFPCFPAKFAKKESNKKSTKIAWVINKDRLKNRFVARSRDTVCESRAEMEVHGGKISVGWSKDCV